MKCLREKDLGHNVPMQLRLLNTFAGSYKGNDPAS